MYDGIELPSEKPFATIRQMNNVTTSISKAHEAVAVNYGFRVSLHCKSLAQRAAVQEKFRDVLLFDELPLYTASGLLTDSFFEVEIDGEVPLSAGDISGETEYHQIHFELSITRVKHKNRKYDKG